MTDLAAWLLEQISADEQLAQAAYAGPWVAAEDPYGADSCCSPEEETWQVTSADPVQVDVTWHGHEGGGVSGAANAQHIARHDPTRVLAECAAKRAVVEQLSATAEKCPEDDWPDSGDVWEAPLADHARHLLRLLAQPLADRPGFDPSWRLEHTG